MRLWYEFVHVSVPTRTKHFRKWNYLCLRWNDGQIPTELYNAIGYPFAQLFIAVNLTSYSGFAVARHTMTVRFSWLLSGYQQFIRVYDEYGAGYILVNVWRHDCLIVVGVVMWYSCATVRLCAASRVVATDKPLRDAIIRREACHKSYWRVLDQVNLTHCTYFHLRMEARSSCSVLMCTAEHQNKPNNTIHI